MLCIVECKACITIVILQLASWVITALVTNTNLGQTYGKPRIIKDLQRAITNVKYNFTETLFITVDEAHRTTSICRSESRCQRFSAQNNLYYIYA